MIYVRITEGLGNQLFKYACAYSVSKKSDDKIGIDISGYAFRPRGYMLDKMNISGQVLRFPIPKNDGKLARAIAKAKRILLINKSGKCKVVVEDVNTRMKYYPYDFSYNANLYLDGYWQNPRYFDEYREQLIEEFKPKEGVISTFCNKLVDELKNSSSVAVHIRRGDYSAEWLIDEVFYLEAIELLKQKCGNLYFYVFCEDRVYAERFIEKVNETTKISLISGFTDIEEFYLMSACRHQIIANSTFSWWAAYLNCYEDAIVIAPTYKQWGGEYYPEHWICINAKGATGEEDAKC